MENDPNSDAYEYFDYLKYLGKVGNAYMFEKENIIWVGGMHEMRDISYILLDKEAKEIKLEDVLENEKKFNEIYEKHFKLDLKEIPLYDENNVVKTDNFYFTSEGLRFVFQAYEITAYAYGEPSFTIPYSELNGVIKKQYIVNE